MVCGIFGAIGEFDHNTAKKALSTLTHRGPDFCGIEESDTLFFAHQRLSIIDTHHRSHQPLKHKNILISFNGEIYNHKELKTKLQYNFKTNGDAEVILALYLKYKEDFVQHLRGMFAIAIYDNGKILLFRDRLGKKPLMLILSGNGQ
jgi:asparagine synthase (glutamine-hydrolysing)